ncbi:DUF2793 domain-containing protein [Agrobacterium salinitolerans]|uniref:glycine-rich domain-containing protein n=1 Tax=Agrobacterium salinitolerans TaxID=1183413 RepID=UPI0022B84227|nr:DUF2793 domain-containing protein [Agrobacterium salinitolerans]MCZ7893309.1 DUF2793 domain-containing protein [Agrobacterium salinitolerans]
MDRINGADTIDIGGGRRGFRDENLVAGATGTEVTALWLNMMQEEILKVVTEAGLAPSDGDWTQLWQALQILGLAPDRGRRWLAINSMTLSSAPGAPTVGDAYLVPIGATGIWAGNVGKIAVWFGSGWTYLAPTDGHGVGLPDGRVFERIGGTYVEKLALDAQSGKWHYAVAGGTANALTATISPAPAALTAGMKLRLKIASTNTGAATLNVNGLGAVSIRKADLSASEARDLVKDAVVDFTYDGTFWQISGSYVSSLPARHTATYADAGTYTFVVPDGVYWIYARVWGGGGGGGGASNNNACGRGGGGGGYCEGWISVTPAHSLTLVIGSGGAGGVGGGSPQTGADGGTSSVGGVSATGGKGGGYSTSGGGAAGGSGGAGVGGDTNFNGQDGAIGFQLAANVWVAASGGGTFATAPSTLHQTDIGYQGYSPGGGGSGASTNASGGPGSPGRIILQY